MKHLKKLLFGMAATVMLASCSNDELVDNGKGEADGNVFATLNIKLPTGGTRAGDGEEYGQADENYVSRVLVVLTQKKANGDYMFLTYDEADALEGGELKPGDFEGAKTELKYTLNFSAKNMHPSGLDVAGENGQSEVYVFAFCNPTSRLTTLISDMKSGETVFSGNSIGEINSTNTIWNPKNFLMTNCEIPTAVTLPKKAVLVQDHNKPEKAFNLGTVHVKRAAARFDFALGGVNNDNKYTITNTNGEGNMGTVELTDMAMFNIAKYFYYLPRTNSQWDWKGTTTLCGNLEGYVMSYNDQNFKQKASLGSDYSQYYFANLINNPLATGATKDDPTAGSKTLVWTSIRPDDWKSKTEDTNEGWTQDPKNDYRIWRYATENTIPAADATNSTASQKVGITTGVVFKGVFTPANNTVWNGNVIYLYNGIVYGDFAALKAYVTKYPKSKVAIAFDAVSQLKNGTDTDLKKNLLEGVGSVARNGFKAYVPDAGGNTYTMYYYYYNRHNTNGNNSQMGTNEFGVVRNNVYKLKVTTCGSLGEPTSPDDPDDPDEEENAFFTVSCHVMPWTVRINNIEF